MDYRYNGPLDITDLQYNEPFTITNFFLRPDLQLTTYKSLSIRRMSDTMYFVRRSPGVRYNESVVCRGSVYQGCIAVGLSGSDQTFVTDKRSHRYHSIILPNNPDIPNLDTLHSRYKVLQGDRQKSALYRESIMPRDVSM